MGRAIRPRVFESPSVPRCQDAQLLVRWGGSLRPGTRVPNIHGHGPPVHVWGLSLTTRRLQRRKVIQHNDKMGTVVQHIHWQDDSLNVLLLAGQPHTSSRSTQTVTKNEYTPS